MPLRRATGNMYSWVTHTHAHLAGACPHACSYCYVQAMAKRFPAMRLRYAGPICLLDEELAVKYGSGKTIFIEHLNDLFAASVPSRSVEAILDHCQYWPDNTYVFQTKNPIRYLQWRQWLPPSFVLGTTIETNHHLPDRMGKAPAPVLRYEAMLELPASFRKFVTVEPILDFDLEELADWLIELQPDFVNIGADSKGYDLPEPNPDKLRALLTALTDAKIEVRQKTNLARLLEAPQ